MISVSLTQNQNLIPKNFSLKKKLILRGLRIFEIKKNKRPFRTA